ncbi:hypothetical protein MRB53_017605 [Persea americana]|uniref:Uncharacterized protein n=1 Tax=Persea americana TaxID=3435 RepID=A0ACC2M6F6_PERAE|nr:hypothetical protein MRB53_017605 [Persea americana]
MTIFSVLDARVPKLLLTVAKICIQCYMFVLGLEMDPGSLIRRPSKVAMLAYAGIITNVALTMSMQHFLLDPHIQMFKKVGWRPLMGLALVSSNTASPILTRLVTELKLGKSEIGRMVVSAGVMSDMASLILIAVSPIWYDGASASVVVFVVLEWVFLIKVVRRFVDWINEKNPEGRPMNSLHLFLTGALVMVLCATATWVSYDGFLNAFLVGLAFQREGRLTRYLVHKINITLSLLGFPLFFCWIGIEANDPPNVHFEGPGFVASVLKFLALMIVGTVGKVSGTLLATMKIRLPLPEGIAVGLMLHINGHFHIFTAAMARGDGTITRNTFRVMLFVIIFTILYIPLVVRMIVSRARRREESLQLGLQWQDPTGDLRIMVCLQGPHNVPAIINIIELTRGAPNAGMLTVYTMDMVELTGRTAATLTLGDGMDAVTVTDEQVVEMREEITVALQAYEQESGEGLTIRRLLVLSSYEDMHVDVCNSAADAFVALVVMPFHKRQRADGGMEDAYPRFRHVNQKVLEHASCSVGILVDRGLGRTNRGSVGSTTQQVAVIFIGGGDDREALHLASRMAYHPAIKLTAIRLLPDPDAPVTLGGSSRTLIDMQEEENEMELDEQFFSQFYQRHVANGQVGYMEKFVIDGADMLAILRTLVEMYTLFIVGRGEGNKSVLTAGMSDWEEHPELGPIGDVLASSDFSQTASTLIIHQYNPHRKRQQQSWDDEFGFT